MSISHEADGPIEYVLVGFAPSYDDSRPSAPIDIDGRKASLDDNNVASAASILSLAIFRSVLFSSAVSMRLCRLGSVKISRHDSLEIEVGPHREISEGISIYKLSTISGFVRSYVLYVPHELINAMVPREIIVMAGFMILFF